ncbi:MAG: U32 family peptidase, partial [Lachnospiraceae bacterium]
LKEKELDDLTDYLKPYYESGLDGVIVQDLGVADVVRKSFPDMACHASTQMSVSGTEGALYLKKLGFTRVVPARELSLKEIKSIYDATGMEIESFIHGALCYCYSGQCLLSSMIGNRSGNRGRCAQPCRLMYNNSIDSREKYILSPKDMATVEILPELIENGVYSMKIEGRMKSCEYTAGVVSIYRKYIDTYLEKGKQGYHVSEKDMIALMDLYNRGGFNKGYYMTGNGPDMMSVERPNHAGVKAVKAVKVVAGRVTFKALTDIYRGDVFEITKDFNLTTGRDIVKGDEFTMQVPAKYISKAGGIYSRIKCASLVKDITDRYISEKELVREKICARVILSPGENIRLFMWLKDDESTKIEEEGSAVTLAQNKPVDSTVIARQLKKLGDTPFIFESDDDLTVECEGSCFIPMQAVNELRRVAVQRLKMVIEMAGSRIFNGETFENKPNPVPVRDSYHVRLLVSDIEQLHTLEKLSEDGQLAGTDRIYVDYNCFYESEIKAVTEKLSDRFEIFVALPRVLRQNKKKEFEELLSLVKKCNISGFLARNLEECAFLHHNREYNDYPVIADYSVYVWNNRARHRVMDVANEFTAPLELTNSELDMIYSDNMEVVKYGYFPVMVSAQCVKKTCTKCDGKNSRVTISDRKNAVYGVESNCKFCHSVMYIDKPLYTYSADEKIKTNIRYEFTTESGAEMIRILERGPEVFTTGHCYKGVM